MSIADDLEKVLFGVATGPTEYLMDYFPDQLGPFDDYLYRFIGDYSGDSLISQFHTSHTHQEVIWMLEEAIDDARERGL